MVGGILLIFLKSKRDDQTFCRSLSPHGRKDWDKPEEDAAWRDL